MAVVAKEKFETKLQERLDAVLAWKDICKITYTNDKVLHNPYLVDATVATHTRGTGYTPTAVATVDDSVTINLGKISAPYIDDADLAQATFSSFMEIADNMGVVLNEAMETAMLAEHAQWTDFDNTKLGGGAGNINVTVSDIDDIIRAVKTQIRKANGADLMARNGAFIVWREDDFEKVEALAQSQGFSEADKAIANGVTYGFRYMGVWHYSSSKHTAGHVFAGVRQAFNVGILKSTYGKMKEIVNPVVGGSQISGVGFESRIDYAFKAWSKMVPVLFDVLVA